MKLLTCFLLLSAPLFGQGLSKLNFSVGLARLNTQDYLIQSPQNQAPYKFLAPQDYHGLDLRVNIPLSRFFQVETGYRFKRHWVGAIFEQGAFFEWIESTHSIPVRPSLVLRLPNAGIFSRLSCSIGAGVLFDFMQQSEGKPLVMSDTVSVIGGPTNTWIMASTYKPEEINQVKASVSLNGQVVLSCKLLKFLSIDAGYGYVKGTKTLGKGHYTYRSLTSTVLESGEMSTKGEYKYWMFGLSYLF